MGLEFSHTMAGEKYKCHIARIWNKCEFVVQWIIINCHAIMSSFEIVGRLCFTMPVGCITEPGFSLAILSRRGKDVEVN